MMEASGLSLFITNKIPARQAGHRLMSVMIRSEVTLPVYFTQLVRAVLACVLGSRTPSSSRSSLSILIVLD